MISDNSSITTEKLKIIGMHCATCVLTIEKAVKGVRGVSRAQVSLASNEATVSYDSRVTSLRDIVRAIRSAGYDVYRKEVTILVENMVSIEDESIIESKLKRIPGVIDASASHLTRTLIISLNPESRSVEDIIGILASLGYKASIMREAMLEDFSRLELSYLLRWSIVSLAIGFTLFISMIIHIFHGFPSPYYEFLGLIGSSIVLFMPGRRFYQGAYRAFRNLTANMDTLVALGTGSIYVYSLAVTLGLLKGDVYYEAAALIIAFVITGRYIEAKAKLGTGEVVKKLMEIQPQEAYVVRGGREIKVPISEVKVGDIIVVRQGEKIPVDGIIVKGKAYIDESMFTGEPIPREKSERDPVYAGSIVTGGWLYVIATRVGGETTLAQIAKLVSQAQTGKLSIQRIVDRIAGLFTWIIMSIAIITFIIWYFVVGASLERSLVFMASVLLVACPCALGIATPTAVVAGVNIAARSGVVVRNVEVLERINSVNLIAFDKTGTLTLGKPTVVAVIPSSNYTVDHVLAYAAIAEKLSEHPIAKAILEEYLSRYGKYPRDPESFESIPGMGLIASLEGETIGVGNSKLMAGLEVNIEPLADISSKLMSEGVTVVYVAKGSRLIGLIGIADKIKDGVIEAIGELRERGLKLVMLTGDKVETAKSIASKIGITDVYAELDPEAKAEIVKELQRKGFKVMMVGDGVNDAPSLSRANVGVAMGTGADISKEAGDIIITDADIKKIPLILEISDKTRKRIYFNLFWAFIYNIILVPIAAGVLAPIGITLRPEMAAAAMALSSITVTLSSYQLSKWKPR
ncbi:MAG: heavy metal translocating P-type ATPase [Acidilobaceae archaeon]